jgi:ketosteroid isomerase-like protein
MPSNLELVQSLYDAFARGDADAVLGAMHPDVDWNEAERVAPTRTRTLTRAPSA